MPKHKKPSTATASKRSAEVKLARKAKWLAPSMLYYDEAEKRALNIYNKAVQLRVAIGSGSRCFPHHPCRNLGCFMCRSRAQVAYVMAHKAQFKTKKRKSGGGSRS